MPQNGAHAVRGKPMTTIRKPATRTPALAMALTATLAFATLGSTFAAAHEPKQVLMPDDAATKALYEQFGFSEAVIDRGTVYISGVIAGPAKEGQSDEEAIDATFQNIGRILERAGSSWEDVVDVTSFHTDLAASGPAFVAVKNRYLKAPFAAWTAIDIDALYIPGGLVEIKVVARVSAKD